MRDQNNLRASSANQKMVKTVKAKRIDPVSSWAHSVRTVVIHHKRVNKDRPNHSCEHEKKK